MIYFKLNILLDLNKVTKTQFNQFTRQLIQNSNYFSWVKEGFYKVTISHNSYRVL